MTNTVCFEVEKEKGLLFWLLAEGAFTFSMMLQSPRQIPNSVDFVSFPLRADSGRQAPRVVCRPNPLKLCVISATIRPSVPPSASSHSDHRADTQCSVAVTEAEAFMPRYWIITIIRLRYSVLQPPSQFWGNGFRVHCSQSRALA